MVEKAEVTQVGATEIPATVATTVSSEATPEPTTRPKTPKMTTVTIQAEIPSKKEILVEEFDHFGFTMTEVPMTTTEKVMTEAATTEVVITEEVTTLKTSTTLNVEIDDVKSVNVDESSGESSGESLWEISGASGDQASGVHQIILGIKSDVLKSPSKPSFSEDEQFEFIEIFEAPAHSVKKRSKP